jgi:hypothetical protein
MNRDFNLLIHCFLNEDYLIISEMRSIESTLTAVTAVTAKVTAVVNITTMQNKVLGGRYTRPERKEKSGYVLIVIKLHQDQDVKYTIIAE